jgi:uroporphyrinogen decarboxylase
MRQAGRYLPAYRAVRAKHSLLEIAHTPTLAAQVTLQPVDELNVDAAILFADILLPFEPLGLGLAFEEGRGPRITNPVRTPRSVTELPAVDPERDLGYVLEAVRLVKKNLAARATPVGLIGFAGAPFTLASYAIEGGATRDFTPTKRFMYRHPEAWGALLGHLAELAGRFLSAQVEAGADAVQLFDSWVGCLSPEDYRCYVQPHTRRAIELARAAGAPVIHFGTGTATLLESMAEAGGDVIGVDWRIPLDEAWARIGDRGIQGNLDPAALFGPRDELARRVQDIVRRAGGRPGHIFNLGHGVLPGTPVESLRAVVSMVRELQTRR